MTRANDNAPSNPGRSINVSEFGKEVLEKVNKLKSGDKDQVLTKNSNTDFDFKWIDPSKIGDKFNEYLDGLKNDGTIVAYTGSVDNIAKDSIYFANGNVGLPELEEEATNNGILQTFARTADIRKQVYFLNSPENFVYIRQTITGSKGWSNWTCLADFNSYLQGPMRNGLLNPTKTLDLNTVDTNTFIWCNEGCKNLPTGKAGTLMHLAGGRTSFATQMFTEAGGDVYFRALNISGKWSDWSKGASTEYEDSLKKTLKYCPGQPQSWEGFDGKGAVWQNRIDGGNKVCLITVPGRQVTTSFKLPVKSNHEFKSILFGCKNNVSEGGGEFESLLVNLENKNGDVIKVYKIQLVVGANLKYKESVVDISDLNDADEDKRPWSATIRIQMGANSKAKALTATDIIFQIQYPLEAWSQNLCPNPNFELNSDTLGQAVEFLGQKSTENDAYNDSLKRTLPYSYDTPVGWVGFNNKSVWKDESYNIGYKAVKITKTTKEDKCIISSDFIPNTRGTVTELYLQVASSVSGDDNLSRGVVYIDIFDSNKEQLKGFKPTLVCYKSSWTTFSKYFNVPSEFQTTIKYYKIRFYIPDTNLGSGVSFTFDDVIFKCCGATGTNWSENICPNPSFEISTSTLGQAISISHQLAVNNREYVKRISEQLPISSTKKQTIEDTPIDWEGFEIFRDDEGGQHKFVTWVNSGYKGSKQVLIKPDPNKYATRHVLRSELINLNTISGGIKKNDFWILDVCYRQNAPSVSDVDAVMIVNFLDKEKKLIESASITYGLKSVNKFVEESFSAKPPQDISNTAVYARINFYLQSNEKTKVNLFIIDNCSLRARRDEYTWTDNLISNPAFEISLGNLGKAISYGHQQLINSNFKGLKSDGTTQPFNSEPIENIRETSVYSLGTGWKSDYPTPMKQGDPAIIRTEMWANNSAGTQTLIDVVRNKKWFRTASGTPTKFHEWVSGNTIIREKGKEVNETTYTALGDFYIYALAYNTTGQTETITLALNGIGNVVSGNINNSGDGSWYCSLTFFIKKGDTYRITVGGSTKEIKSTYHVKFSDDPVVDYNKGVRTYGYDSSNHNVQADNGDKFTPVKPLEDKEEFCQCFNETEWEYKADPLPNNRDLCDWTDKGYIVNQERYKEWQREELSKEYMPKLDALEAACSKAFFLNNTEQLEQFKKVLKQLQEEFDGKLKAIEDSQTVDTDSSFRILCPICKSLLTVSEEGKEFCLKCGWKEK